MRFKALKGLGFGGLGSKVSVFNDLGNSTAKNIGKPNGKITGHEHEAGVTDGRDGYESSREKGLVTPTC